MWRVSPRASDVSAIALSNLVCEEVGAEVEIGVGMEVGMGSEKVQRAIKRKKEKTPFVSPLSFKLLLSYTFPLLHFVAEQRRRASGQPVKWPT